MVSDLSNFTVLGRPLGLVQLPEKKLAVLFFLFWAFGFVNMILVAL
jgi:hypothetical protein